MEIAQISSMGIQRVFMEPYNPSLFTFYSMRYVISGFRFLVALAVDSISGYMTYTG